MQTSYSELYPGTNPGIHTRTGDCAHYDRCRTLMLLHRKRHLKRTICAACIIGLNAIMNITRLPFVYQAAYKHGYGFFFAISFMLYTVVTLAVTIFATQEKPKLLVLLLLLLLMGMLDKWVPLWLGIPLLGMFLAQIPESRQAVQIKTMPGYPHFNERFDEQMQYFGKEYQPDHVLDKLRDAEMPEMPDVPSPDFVLPAEISSVPEMLSSSSDDICGVCDIHDTCHAQKANDACAACAIQDIAAAEPETDVVFRTYSDSVISENRISDNSIPDDPVPDTGVVSGNIPGKVQENSLQTDRILASFRQPE